jgi:hypothetical protein
MRKFWLPFGNPVRNIEEKGPMTKLHTHSCNMYFYIPILEGHDTSWLRLGEPRSLPNPCFSGKPLNVLGCVSSRLPSGRWVEAGSVSGPELKAFISLL